MNKIKFTFRMFAFTLQSPYGGSGTQQLLGHHRFFLFCRNILVKFYNPYGKSLHFCLNTPLYSLVPISRPLNKYLPLITYR